MTKRPPTILQVVPRLDAGGAELTTLEIAAALARAGARALVASDGGRLAADIARQGGVLIDFPAATKNPVRMLVNARRLTSLIGSERIDLIHARSRAPAWSALIAARRAKIPFVTTYHGAYGEVGPLKKLYNSVMVRADRVIANSAFTARLIEARYRSDADRVRIIHRGVDLARFDPQALGPADERLERLKAQWQVPAGHRIVLNAARLASWKGQRVVIDAARRLKASGAADKVVFVLAGDVQGRVGYRGELVDAIAAAGLAERFRLPGHVGDMPAAFAIADVAVIASTEPEAFGRTATEAQAMGCPVIATDIGAPPETVLVSPPERRTGWLVPPRDAEALAAAMAAALAMDAGARAALAAGARAHVTANFSLKRMQEATLAVYDELLGTALARATT